MVRRFSLMVLVSAVMLGACQGTQGSAPGDAAATVAATAPATAQASQSIVVGNYTHEDAVRFYREAKYKHAEALCLKGIAEIEKTKGDKAPELASPLDDLTTVYLRLARFVDAKPLIERAESVLDKTKPQDAIMLGRLAINKGWRMYSMGDVRGAEKVFVEGRDLIQKNQKNDSLELAELINNIGLMYDDADSPGESPNQRKVAKARVLLLQSWEMRKKLAGAESAECQESLSNLGMHLLFHAEGENSVESATGTIKKALEMSEKVYGADHPETAVAHVNLALALKMTEDDEGAEEQIRIALPVTEKHLGKNHPDRAYELQVLGQVQQESGDYKEAEENFLEALRIYELTYGPEHSNVANPLGDLRDLYEDMNDEVKAKAMQKRIEKLRGKEI